jgi:hypothetical protein
VQPLGRFPAFYGTRRFITAFTRTLHLYLITANVPSSLFLVTLMMEAVRSFDTSVLTVTTRQSIPEDSTHSNKNVSSEVLTEVIIKNAVL